MMDRFIPEHRYIQNSRLIQNPVKYPWLRICSEKKLEYNTVQLHVYKEEYIYACMMNNIYIQKSIFDMKINLNNNYECNKN